MKKKRFRVLFWLGGALLLFNPALARAQASCLPEFTSLQVLESVHPPRHFETKWYPLLAEGPGGRVATRAVLQVEAGTANPQELRLTAMFDPDFDGVSLAYNLYAVLVLIDGVPQFFHDYTSGCQGLPPSFYPGGQITLPAVKLIGDKPQKLQIMVWGRL